MNQILVSEKLYVTPDIKKKRKLFKVEFFLSVFLLCVLSSYAIYAEYDRNKSEKVSKEILDNMNLEQLQATTTKIEEPIVVILNSKEKKATSEKVLVQEEIEVPEEQKSIASDGTVYYTVGRINIPSIEVDYPIFSTTTPELLKISPCKFWGPNPNQVRKLMYSWT